MSSITRGVQQGVLRHLEQPSVTGRIPATRSNPAFEFGRKFREKRESAGLFLWGFGSFRSIKWDGTKVGFREALSFAIDRARAPRAVAQRVWAKKEQTSEHKFYFNDLIAEFRINLFYMRLSFSDAQLREIRGFYEKTISRPDVFTSDMAFADALSSFIGISFVGDADLAGKMVSLAKAAPEGKRMITDFVVTRALERLQRYDLLQELLDFRQVQEGWFFAEGEFFGGETASVYEEINLGKQIMGAMGEKMPVTFYEQLPARSTIHFSVQDKKIIRLMEPFPRALFKDYMGEELTKINKTDPGMKPLL